MAVTDGNLQALLIASLSAADPDSLTMLQAQTPLYWQLYTRTAYKELQYWYTRRDLLRVLMSCARNRIDYAKTLSNATRQVISNSRMDATSNSTSSMTSSATAQRTSTSSANNSSNSSASATNNASHSTNQNATTSASMSDTGSGSSHADRTTIGTTTTTEQGSVETVDKDDYGLHHEINQDGYREMHITQGTDFGFSVFAGTAPTISLDLGALGVFEVTLPLFGPTQHTKTEGPTNQYSETFDDITQTGPGAFRKRTSQVNVLSAPKRTLTMDETDVGNQNSHFNNNMTMTSTGTSHTDFSGSSSSHANMSASGSGSGSSVMQSTSSSAMHAQSERTSHMDAEAHSSTQALARHDASMAKQHQLFLHLKELWDRCTATIEWLEKQHLNLPSYICLRMLTEHPDKIDAQIANCYLVATPITRTVLQGTLR